VEQIRKDIESCDCQDKLETLLSHKEKGWRLYHKMKSGEVYYFKLESFLYHIDKKQGTHNKIKVTFSKRG
jgi:hypothetical protein